MIGKIYASAALFSGMLSCINSSYTVDTESENPKTESEYSKAGN